MNIRFFLTFLLLAISIKGWSQLSDTHYIPPFYAVNDNSTLAQEQEVYITTPHDSAVYTITNGSGTILQTGTVKKGEYKSLDSVGYDTPFICDDTELNQVLTNKGYIITADSSMYVSMRVTAGSLGNPSQAGSLTSKGFASYGTTYRLGHFPSIENHKRKSSGYSIMATEDNTVVTINFKSAGMVFDGAGAPSSAVPLSINLNKGETYTAAIHMPDSPNNLDTGLIGTLITSTKAIAVNTGSWAGSLRNHNGADVGIDQIVDASLVGDEYVLVRGQGKGSNDDDMEQVMVVAHEDGTSIFVNANPAPVATINAGEFYLIDGSNYINEAMHITTSKASYVYQFILGGDNTTNTQGMNFVPPISCYTSQEVNSIPVIDSIGTKRYQGGLTIVTRTGSSILVNGAVPTVAPIDVIGQYEAYKIEGLTGDVVVSTNSIALVGFFGFSGNAGYGGYYSGFDQVTFNSGLSDDCPPGVLNVASNLPVNYQWYLDGNLLVGETNDSLLFTTEGDYNVVFERNGCLDTSTAITIFPLPSVDMGADFGLCDNRDSIVTLTPEVGTTITWFGTTASNTFNVDTPGVYWVELDNVNGCFDTDTLEVFESDFTSDLGEDFTLCSGWDTLVTVNHSDDVIVTWFGTDENDSYLIDSKGLYWFELSDDYNCKQNDSVTVQEEDCSPVLKMPNVMVIGSPYNYSLTPIVSEYILNDVKLEVYNRWGVKVAHEVLLHRGWDGTIAGRPVSSGTYFWVMEYKSLNKDGETTHRANGFIQVLK